MADDWDFNEYARLVPEESIIYYTDALDDPRKLVFLWMSEPTPIFDYLKSQERVYDELGVPARNRWPDKPKLYVSSTRPLDFGGVREGDTWLDPDDGTQAVRRDGEWVVVEFPHTVNTDFGTCGEPGCKLCGR